MKREIENLAENKQIGKDKEMSIKRLLSGVILFPIFAVILILGNKYIVDIFISIVAIMSLHEFYKAFKKKANPIQWPGYLTSVLICFIHLIPGEYVLPSITLVILINVLVLFIQVVVKNMKRNITDIAISLFGICYIVFFLMFAPLIRDSLEGGKILIWYVFFAAWGTDIFAYLIGKNFGKHKFTEVSPNKSIEGCVGGIFGSIILCVAYTFICNWIWNMEISYIYTFGISVFLSVVSQIGDLAASSVKRHCEIKDYSNLIPGHGGLLDRIDSVIFILPFAYFLLSII